MLNSYQNCPVVLERLEQKFGPLVRLDSGMEGRVYLAQDDLILKVYRNQKGHHIKEAQNMQQAGLGDWVQGTFKSEQDGVEVLVMRRFYGHPITAQRLPEFLTLLSVKVRALHKETRGWVDVDALKRRVRKFHSTLAGYEVADLFAAVKGPLEEGLLYRPASFCHLDLWHDNILVSAPSTTPQLLLIDWNKAAWDDPLRDLALLKTGTLDLLPASQSFRAALDLLPDQQPRTLRCYAAYLALTTLHDLHWFLMNEPYHFDDQYEKKAWRARHSLGKIQSILKNYAKKESF